MQIYARGRRMITVTALGLDALYFLSSNSVVSLEDKTCNAIFFPRLNHSKRVQTRSGYTFKAFASRSSRKRLNKEQKTSKSGNSEEANSEDQGKSTDGFPPRDASYSDLSNTGSDAKSRSSVSSPSRSAVLQACTLTSGLMLALGLCIRQASYIAFTEGWMKLDPMDVSFHFEVWHLVLIAELVILISSCRYILLKTWPDFAESSEAANRQVLSSLEPIDYMVVAFLPGISEELLFRGGLLPIFGLNWISALVVAAIFGILHIGGGRKYPFAAWATFVGFVYAVATITSSSMIVPMASHSLNNLIAGILWRYESPLRETSNS